MFIDLFNLPTHFIPKKMLPSLSPKMKHDLATMENNMEQINTHTNGNGYDAGPFGDEHCAGYK